MPTKVDKGGPSAKIRVSESGKDSKAYEIAIEGDCLSLQEMKSRWPEELALGVVINDKFETTVLEVVKDAPLDDLMFMIDSIRRRISIIAARHISSKLPAIVQKLEFETKLESTKQKQDYCKMFNHLMRAHGTAIAKLPKEMTGENEPATLYVIPDLWGGKFTLESKKTKKRAPVKRKLSELLAVSTIIAYQDL